VNQEGIVIMQIEDWCVSYTSNTHLCPVLHTCLFSPD